MLFTLTYDDHQKAHSCSECLHPSQNATVWASPVGPDTGNESTLQFVGPTEGSLAMSGRVPKASGPLTAALVLSENIIILN